MPAVLRFRKVRLLLVLGAFFCAAANNAPCLNLTAQASSHADSGLSAAQAVDSDPATFWSSSVHVSPTATEWIAVDFSETIPLAGVTLVPRSAGPATYAYPVDYRFEYSYDHSGARWFPVAGGARSNVAQPSAPVEHTFPGKILARRLRIMATRLSPDDSGSNHYFQLAEIVPVAGPDVAPFETTEGEAYNNQLNMLWAVYGTVDDGTAAVYEFGNEPAYYEWLMLKYGWSKSTLAKRAVLTNQLLPQWGQSADGYVWSWADQEKWPTGAGSYHNENNAKYILACWRAWCWTRDSAFFDRIDTTNAGSKPRPDVSSGRTLKLKLREAMRYLEQSLQGNAGGIVLEDNGMNNDGTVTGSPSNYWDNWRMGYKNPYDNVYYYAALEAMAQLETEWGNAARAGQLRAYRAGCKAAYDTTFWDPAKGRYVSTIDKTGKVWDFGSTFINLEALAYGLGDSLKAQAIFAWLDGARIIPGETSQGADIYAWKFAPRANTLAIESTGPPYWWESLGGAINVDGNAGWDRHLENGGAIFYTSYYDIIARIKYLGPDNALQRLNAIVAEFEIDQLRRDPDTWKFGIIGEFPESGLVPCVLIYGFAGLSADSAGLHVAPQLPSAWEWLKLKDLAYAGTILSLHITPHAVYRQHGTRFLRQPLSGGSGNHSRLQPHSPIPSLKHARAHAGPPRPGPTFALGDRIELRAAFSP